MSAEFELPTWIIRPASFVLDVGGEGRHPVAWNLNHRRQRSGASLSAGPIPRLILARAEAIPLDAGSVDVAIVERTPLRKDTLRELARVVRPEGIILLRHAITPAGDPHRVALRILTGQTQRRVFSHRGYQVHETIIARGHPAGRHS